MMDHRNDNRRSLHNVRPNANRRTGHGSKADSPIPTVASNDRVGMLLMEANEISQYLKKDYVFQKGDESLVDDTVNIVKVINSKYNVSCLWPLSKLREKLVRMRKLVYAENSENASTAAVDAILFDGTDTWLPEMSASSSPACTSLDTAGHARTVCTTATPLSHENSPPLNSSSFTKAHASTEMSTAHTQQSSHHHQTSRTSSTASERKDANLANGLAIGSQLKSTFLDGAELAADTQFVLLSPRGAAIHSNLPADADYSDSANSMSRIDSKEPPTKLPSSSCAPRIKEPLRVERPLRQPLAKSVATLSPQQQQHQYHLRPVHASHCTTFTQTDTIDDATITSALTEETALDELLPSCQVHGTTQTVKGEALQSFALSLSSSSQPCNDLQLFKLCKDVTRMMLTRLSLSNSSGGNLEIVDRVLRLCQSIRLGIAVVLRAYIPTADLALPISSGFGDNCQLETVCIQLVLATELLVANIEFWCLQQTGQIVALTALYDTQKNLMQMVKEMSKDMIVFWQACDNKVEVLIQDTSAKILNLLLELVTESGKMAVVAGVCPQTLAGHKRTSLEQLLLQRSARPDDLLSVDPATKVKQAFLSGCDIMVDETLQDCLQALEDNESILQTSAENCQAVISNNCVKEEVLQRVFVVLTRCKMLLAQLQQTQVELDSAIKDETDKPTNYYHHYFERCSAVLSAAHKVTDSITLLTRAVEPFHTEIYGEMLRKICRCSEVVQRAACWLSHTSSSSKNCFTSSTAIHTSPTKRMSLDLSSLASSDEGGGVSPLTIPVANSSLASTWSGISLCDSFTLLSSTQSENLRQLINSVSQATDELCRVVKLRLAQEEVVASASTSLAASNTVTAAGHIAAAKRMLPVVPGSSVIGGSVVMRCHSARSSYQRASALSKHISLLNFPLKKSSEI